jgi:hypothetical protein
MREGVPYAAGTSLRSVNPAYRMHSNGLLVPVSFHDRQPMDLMGTWVTLEDYLQVDPE